MIEFCHVSAGYGRDAVVRDVSFTAPRGRITALIGPNGSGKTTLLRAGARLLPLVQGEIRLDGQPISAYSRRDFARKAAFLPQSRPLPEMTVRSLVEQGRFPHLGLSRKLTARDREAVAEAMELTRTADWASRDVRALSGGERQRVYIAMVLAQGAEAIFLDEPTTYLDLRCQFELLALIRALNAQGKTFVLVLHDLSHALLYSDQVVLMERGRVAACAAPDALIQSGKIDAVMGVRTHLTADGHPYFTQGEGEGCR